MTRCLHQGVRTPSSPHRTSRDDDLHSPEPKGLVDVDKVCVCVYVCVRVCWGGYLSRRVSRFSQGKHAMITAVHTYTTACQNDIERNPFPRQTCPWSHIEGVTLNNKGGWLWFLV